MKKGKKKDKKIIIITILVILIVAVVLVFLLKMMLDQREEKLLKNKILVEEYHYAYATSDGYWGKAIYSDGKIYEFNFKKSDDLVGLSLSNRSKIIKKEGVLLKEKVSEKDIELLKTYVKNVKDRYTGTLEYQDAQTNGLAIYNHFNEEWIKLVEKGEYVGNNRSSETKKIIEIVQKYNVATFYK